MGGGAPEAAVNGMGEALVSREKDLGIDRHDALRRGAGVDAARVAAVHVAVDDEPEAAWLGKFDMRFTARMQGDGGAGAGGDIAHGIGSAPDMHHHLAHGLRVGVLQVECHAAARRRFACHDQAQASQCRQE